MKCAICGKEMNERVANNGEPLVKGKVCPMCNRRVITARMMQSNVDAVKGNNDKKED